ncbi:MAG: hypothetical protein LBS09_09160 [Bacteroidales bacterium]|nr:hypothetical protein [Bacteroidales bacterium]
MTHQFLRATCFVLFVAAIFSACGKENLDNAIFTPDKNLTHAQIVRLLADAWATSLQSSEMTMVEFSQITRANGTVESFKYVYSNKNYGLSATRKTIGIEFDVDGTREFLTYLKYTEGFTEYCYDAYYLQKEKYLLTDAYYDQTDEENDTYEELFNEMQWNVEGDMLVGTRTYTNVNYPPANRTETIAITLTGSKKLKNVKEKYVYQNPPETTEYDATYTYISNFTLPAGIVLSDFTARPQYRVTVRWGSEAGGKTNLFYTVPVDDDGDGVIDGARFPIADAVEYMPKVAGKHPTFYLNATFTPESEVRNGGNVWDIMDNNTVLYVKWVATPSGFSSSAQQANTYRKKTGRNLIIN